MISDLFTCRLHFTYVSDGIHFTLLISVFTRSSYYDVFIGKLMNLT